MAFLVASVALSLIFGAFELASHLSAVITGVATVALVYSTTQSVTSLRISSRKTNEQDEKKNNAGNETESVN